MALTSGGQVYAWGDNSFGQIGTGGTGGYVPTPRQVTGLPGDITAISSGGGHSLALTADGQVYAWGNNGEGELGAGTTSGPVATPQRVTGLPAGITAISSGDGHSLALTEDGQVYAWGWSGDGALGIGTTGGAVATPQRVTGLPAGITAITAGGSHSLALARAFTVTGPPPTTPSPTTPTPPATSPSSPPPVHARPAVLPPPLVPVTA